MPIEDVILTTENCRYCLMCRHIAPVEKVTYKETLSPHGWALIIASVRRGLLAWDEDTVDAVYSAPDGGNSRAHCVTNQPLPEAIAAARAEIAQQGLAPAVCYEINTALEKWGTPFAQRSPEASRGQGEVALFIGDEAEYLWPETIPAVLRLLGACGIEPVLIGNGRSNGFLASSLGFPETAKNIAQATLDDLEASGAKRLLVLSPGDYFAFGQLYDERLGLPWPEEVKLDELTVYLSSQIDAGKLRFGPVDDQAPYAYVDPTHAVRVPARHDTPRNLLARIMPGQSRELFWRRERAHPVGSTALQFTKPDISEKLTKARLKDAQQSGAQVIFTDDPGTLAQLQKYAGDFGLRLQGLYELLAAQIG